MSVILQSVQIRDAQPAVTPAGAQDATVVFGDYTIVAGNGAANHVIEMFELPPGMVVADLVLDTDDLDTSATPTGAIRVGLLAGTTGDTTFANRTSGNAIGNEFVAAGNTIVQTGGILRATATGFTRVAPTQTRRSVGVQFSAALATAAVGAKLRLSATIRPAIHSA